ncbi:MAG: T9SS type A sorting domain-containing protein [Ignavibacteriae bacterium]|nr:T9SS type A sorting domain-containing protein [Ignavibacteriota bacterium]
MKKLFVVLVMLAAMSANAQWSKSSGGMMKDSLVYSFTSIGSNIYAGANGSSNGTGRIYVSSNGGTNWSELNGLFNVVNCIAAQGSNLLVGANGGLFITSNNGANWISTLTDQNIISLGISGNTILAGTYSSATTYGVFRSTNNGSNWTLSDLTGKVVQSIYFYGFTIAPCGKRLEPFSITYNGGLNWITYSSMLKDVRTFSSIGTNIFAGSDSGVYVSSDTGKNWTPTSLMNQLVTSLAVNGNNLFAAAGGKVYLSKNNGLSWVQKSEGLVTNVSALSLFVNGNYIYLGCNGQSVWRRLLSDIISVQNISTEIPSAFSLSQNYPNPFNPTTVIRFGIPSLEGYAQRGVGMVTLKVFDIAGREIQSLVNENLQPGTYETSFDGSRLTSGVYFYKLETNRFSDVKKMLMIK